MIKGKTVKIVIATHKKFRMPTDEIYLPLYVGAEKIEDGNRNNLNMSYMKDNTGDNISKLNGSFCELTGLYWAWKNVYSDYIGLVHYRRHFAIRKKGDLWKRVLTYNDIQPFIGNIKVVVPNKRKYYIETLYSHYEHTHYAKHLDVTREIISEEYPDYLKNYDKVVKHREGYMFNMMIIEREFMNDYCEWLFTILFKLHKRLDISKLSTFQGRFYGRVSEIIFNVWLNYQVENGRIKKKEIMEIPYLHMEKINWVKKGSAFLKAKFLKRKYEGSF